MDLPLHIAKRIEVWVAETPKQSFHADHEAAKYGGLSLFGTIGSIWLLRPDGTFWEVDDDTGKPLQPLAEEFHTMALVAGADRHQWLRELIPERPPVRSIVQGAEVRAGSTPIVLATRSCTARRVTHSAGMLFDLVDGSELLSTRRGVANLSESNA